MKLGERMKMLRKQKHINADTLAEKIGVSRSTIFRYEKGEIEKVPMAIVEKVADALDVSLPQLMGMREDTLDEIHNTASKLNSDRQKNVLNFAKGQLFDQQNEFPDTLAAHQADSKHIISDDEAKDISDYLDAAIDKHENRNK